MQVPLLFRAFSARQRRELHLGRWPRLLHFAPLALGIDATRQNRFSPTIQAPMRTSQLIKRNLNYYWRTNLVVVLGVATAVAVLAGALLVGDSVRASLRDLFLQRLGNTDSVISTTGFFRDQLAADIQNDKRFAAGGFKAACPMIAIDGTVSNEASGLRASGVRVYGVDERFWTFHESKVAPQREQPARADGYAPRNREILVSEALARELGSVPGNALLVRVQKPSEIPIESLHSRKEDLGSTLRLTVRAILAGDALGEFSLQPQQSAVRAVFVPLSLLQKQLDQENKVNEILVADTSHAENDAAKSDPAVALLSPILKDRTSLEDFGVKLRNVGAQPSEPPAALTGGQENILVEHDSKVLNDSLADSARKAADRSHLRVTSVLSYLANSISFGERSIPYSLVTALDEETFKGLTYDNVGTQGHADEKSMTAYPPLKLSKPGTPPIILNEWAAHDLGVNRGDVVTIEYYVWHEDGRLETRTAQFQLASITPIKGLAADKDLVPEYPGITGSENLSNWDPPFPVDLKRIRKQDEDYWHQYRTTPKAFIPLAAGQQLWQSRFGKLTSLRLAPAAGTSQLQALDIYKQELKMALDPAASGFTIIPARRQGLEASRGATDFGEYFLYFSFFLVASALMLTALFFKLGIEQRLREIGVLQAAGFSASRIRALFLMEGALLSVLGSLLGLIGAVGYAQLMMFGLRTWWVDAVGTTMLRLHVSPLSLLLGAAGGVVASLLCVVWTLRQVGKQSTRSLLMGALTRDPQTSRHGDTAKPTKRLFTSLRAAIMLSLLGVLLMVAAALHFVGSVSGFFGSGVLLLTAFFFYQAAWLRRSGKTIHGVGWWSVTRLGFRNATNRPGRSVLCIALVASAAFIIVSVDAFRHRGDIDKTRDTHSGSGGFPLLAESLLPLVHDPNTREGREALNLVGEGPAGLGSVRFTRFRVRPGDDASCLNLYQPRSPKIIAPTADFIAGNRFAFQSSLAGSNEEKQNPWLLLQRDFGEGVVPVIADANSMTYVLHLKLGEDFVLDRPDGPVHLRLVGSLADSVFQSELVMGEKHFLRLFPEQQGYRFFLIDMPESASPIAIAATLEDRLSDFGFDVVPTGERLANFHRVENTYLSTFQMLGGLGLLLGTLGMAAVLLRNVLERRRELALLRAVGYDSSHFTLMVVAENLLLLVGGLVTGTVCALLAIAPVFFARGGKLPHVSLGLLLLAVLVSGLTASLVATWAALRSPLLPALRSE
ncbi:MAG: FtsX-like permease family protein [bacterium]